LKVLPLGQHIGFDRHALFIAGIRGVVLISSHKFRI